MHIVNFTIIHPPQAEQNYVCPKCRVQAQGSPTPYEPNQFGTFVIDGFNDTHALISATKCVVCSSEISSALSYQAEFISFMKEILKLPPSFNLIYSLIGAKHVAANFDMQEGKRNIVDLELLDISADAAILDINLTSCGKFIPYEIHGNSIRAKQDPDDKKLYLWPAEEPRLAESESKIVSISVTWLPAAITEKNQNILEMLQGLVSKEQNKFIMGANRSIEQLVLQICTKSFSMGISTKKKKEVKNALISSMTYSYQLKYLLKLISKAEDLPVISTSIIDILDNLRSYRNDVAHHGHLTSRTGEPRKLSEVDYRDISSNVIVAYGLLSELLRALPSE